MNVKSTPKEQTEQFIQWYGDGTAGACPTSGQWAYALSLPSTRPFKLMNFFKFREIAEYKRSAAPVVEISGADAFDLYAAVSIPTMQRVGGSFVHVGPLSGVFIGEQEQWDLIAIGSYPNVDAFLALYTDPAYRDAFAHRTAACLDQKVLISTEAI